MKLVPAIIESAIDLDQVGREILEALKLFTVADEDARRRRLELGKLLIRARSAFPRSGPKAKGWGEYIAKLGIDQQRAWDWMAYAGHVEVSPHDGETGLPPMPSHRKEPDSRQGHTQPVNESVDESESTTNVHGGSGDIDRGTYCTPKWINDAVGTVDVDPFSNPRSTVHADVACMLERGDNGLVTADLGGAPGVWICKATGAGMATAGTKLWFQPPYEIVLEAFAHYRHTRFIALLRLDPSTEWFAQIHAASELILLTRDRVDFQPPRGVLAEGEVPKGSPFPHALFFAHAEDATDAIRALCFEWNTNNQKAN